MKYSPHQKTKLLTAIIWLAGVVILLIKSSSLFWEAFQMGSRPLVVASTFILAIVIGLVKGRLLFTRICKKNLQRINAINNPTLWHSYRPRFYIFLGLMISSSKISYHLAKNNPAFLIGLAALEMSVAIALLSSIGCFKENN